MLIQTKDGMKKIESNPPVRKVKKPKENNDPLSKIKVELLDFAVINSELNMQFNNGNKHFVEPDIVGQVKVGQKVILITSQCEMICQYAYKFGYELPIYIDGDDEPVMIVEFERKDLTRSKKGGTKSLTDVLGKNLHKRGVFLRANQLARRVEDSTNSYNQQKLWD